MAFNCKNCGSHYVTIETSEDFEGIIVVCEDCNTGTAYAPLYDVEEATNALESKAEITAI